MIFTAFLVLSGELRADQVYPVGGLDPESEKFDRIYRAVADSEKEKATKAATVHELEVFQHVEDDFYLVTHDGTTYGLHSGDPARLWTDGTKLELPVVIGDGVYQYISVAGSKKTVAILKVRAVPKRMTKADFILALKAGVEFRLEWGMHRERCQICKGFGHTSSVSPETSRCRNCGGAGFFYDPKYYVIKW